MACPTVAGVVATLLQRFPNYTPRQIRDQLIRESTPNVVNMQTFRGSGLPTIIARDTPNRFAYTGRCENSKAIIRMCALYFVKYVVCKTLTTIKRMTFA